MSRFTEWSKEAETSPARWTKPKPKVRIIVRLMAAVAGGHVAKIEPGEPGAFTGINRTRITFPDPLDDHDYPTDACRAFLIETIHNAVRQDGYLRWIQWPDGTTTACTSRHLPPVTTSPSSSPVLQPGFVITAEPSVKERDANTRH